MRGRIRLNRTTEVILGSIIFAVGINLFLTPANLYSGGFLGIGQIIRTILVEYLGLPFGGIDLAGILYYLINVPLLLLAYKEMGKKFFALTVVGITVQTIFITFLPTNVDLMGGDRLANSIVAALLSGYGCGVVLSAGGCSGGTDIVGLYTMKKNATMSVGKIAMAIDIAVYIVCLAMYDVTTVLYSVIYMAIAAFVTDRVHLQNVNMKAVIVTQRPDVVNGVVADIGRAVTMMDGRGGYRGEKYTVIYTVLSKYEARALRQRLELEDPDAFITFSDVRSIMGNYEKHL